MTRSFYVEIIDPLNPGGPPVEATIPDFLIAREYKRSDARYANFEVVHLVLREPSRIYRGLREWNHNHWCFVGRPEFWHLEDKATGTVRRLPFPQDLIYAVYLNDRYFVHGFGPRDAEPPGGTHIANSDQHFGGVQWSADGTS